MKPRDEQLDERSKRILRELIVIYCETGEPVGSRTLARKGGMELSPATVRNVLADLEEMGYIHQPHTSAGRIPTDKGYRFYVNYLMRSHGLNSGQREYIQSAYSDAGSNFEGLLSLTTNLLAHLSRQIALAVAPNLDLMILENIDFVPISSTRLLAVLVTRGGVVTNKIVDLDEAVTYEEITRIANYIRSKFSGLTLPAIRRKLLEMMKLEQTQYDQLLKRTAMIGQKTLANLGDVDHLFVNGASKVVSYPEFSDVERTRDLLAALEEKSRIVRILTKCIEGEGIHIFIGEENRTEDLKDMSLISSPYCYGDQAVGTVAILGPTRMEYARIIPLVDHIAKVVSNILSKEN